MQIQDYINILRRRWWLIAVVAFTAAAVAYGISKTRTPIYRSQAVYGVYVNRVDSGANMFADKLLNSYIVFVYSPDALQSIANQLHLDRTGDWLMNYVRIQPQPDAMKIVVEADYFSPDDAQQLAAAVGDRLVAVVAEQNRTREGQDRVNVDVTQRAKAAWKAKPNTKINVLAGTILGAVLGLLLAFALEYADDTLKNVSDVERFAGLTIVGAIPSGAGDHARGRRQMRPAVASGLIAGRGAGRPGATRSGGSSRIEE